MTNKRTKSKSWWALNPEPKGDDPIASRSGCKVSWRTYATRERAEEMAAWATREGEHKASMGYDFGYCCPGSITPVLGGYEVTFA